MEKNEKGKEGREWGCHFKWEVRSGPKKKVTFKPWSERCKKVSHVNISWQSNSGRGNGRSQALRKGGLACSSKELVLLE